MGIESRPLPQRASSASITAIIPSWRRPDLTERCLRSLAQQTEKSGKVDIVIVENEAQQSTVFPVESLPAAFPFPVRQILLDQNLWTTHSLKRSFTDTS